MLSVRKKLKVLIVDDSNLILNSLKSFFEDYDFEVITCSDGLEGIQKTAEKRPDVIFLDLMMPNFDGIKMLQVKKVLKDIKDIPVIVISANTARSNVLAAMEAGADRVISKPLEKEVIKSCVNELLSGEHFSENSANKISDNDQKGIKDKLVNFFLDSFDNKKQKIKESLAQKNSELLKTIVHELKGAGGTIGYPELSELSNMILEKEFKNPSDWLFAELKSGQIFQKVNEIQRETKKYDFR